MALEDRAGRWIWALALALGALAGIGGFTMHYARATSYLSDDPEVCVNCHIMKPQYDGWTGSSHHAVATCVDCHLPHGLVGKYFAKGRNGYFHSKAFTMQDFPEPIRITPYNARILEANCRDCHQGLVHELLGGTTADPDEVRCVHCHQDVGHGEPVGLGGPAREGEEG